MANTYRWKHSALAAAIFVAAGLQLNDASALTLGQVRVQSNLGEPLRATIPVSNLTPDEAQTLRANPASPDVFNAHGANYSAIMTQLEVRLQQHNDGNTVLQLSTAAPVNEPFLDLVLNTSWNGGSAVRSYAILLDPPSAKAKQAPISPAQTAPAFAPAPAVSNTSTAAALAAAPVGAAPATARIAPSAPVDTKMDPTVYQRASEWMRSQGQSVSGQVTPAARPTRAATPATATAAARPATAANTTSAVTTRRGDTASAIARRHLPANVSLDQMLLALLRSNPQAFVNGNVNLLRAGVTLSIPNVDEAQSVSPQEARSLISAQTRDFNQYRNQIARKAPVAPMAPQAADTSSGMVTAAPTAPATNANSDKLELSSQQASEARRAEEARIATQLQAKEDAARKQEAEENTRRMEQLLKEANEAAQTATASASAATPASAPATAPANPEATGTAANGPTANGPTTETSPGPAGITIEAQAPANLPTAAITNTPANSEPVAPGEDIPPTATPEASTTPEANPQAATTPAPAPAPAPTPKPAPAPKPAAQPQPAPAPAPFYSMFGEDPLLPAAGGALLILLLGWGYYRYRQGRKDQEVVYENSGNVPDSFFNTDGTKVDKNATPATGNHTGKSGLSTGLSTGVSSMSYSPSQIDATGEGDPVLEADVLLAYGRDQQAEEVLKESEITNPSRTAIKVRLAEIYASRQDRISFEAKAQEVARLTEKTGLEWIKVAELGRNLDPNNELYKQMGSATPAAPAPVQANATATSAFAPAAAPVAPAPSLAPAAAVAASTSASSAALSDLGPLSDLDFDFEQSATSKPGNSAFEESRSGAVSAAASLADLDFDLSEPMPLTSSEKKSDEELNTNRGELPAINSNSLEFENLLPPSANKLEVKSHVPGVSGLDSIRSPLSAPQLDDFGFDEQSLGTPSGLPTDISTALPNQSSNDDLSHTLDLDLSSLTLDAYDDKPTSDSPSFSSDSTIANLDLQDFSSTDPLSTKLALAKEFLALGDSEGAKALAQEVLNLADGELQQQAEQLLKELDSH
ncbi:hypothetical protein E8K88_10850 [Lampropedia aestuarii]|uniref:LysM domain-containing protein n=1 Tax=Lampropedia aestuarii TaxID=2562762 RepID=A0A4S5BNT4_9BURK|nr:FimV/HubP family polar landmark protein [Lampropedia aestuarii]THJ32783.1 hypothetical protein E8K88_10850 [Lampropedia aestuarii]